MNRPKGMPRQQWHQEQFEALKAKAESASPRYRVFRLLVVLYILGTGMAAASFVALSPPLSMAVLPAWGLASALVLAAAPEPPAQRYLSGLAVAVLSCLAAYPTVIWLQPTLGLVGSLTDPTSLGPVAGHAAWAYALYRTLRTRWAWELFGVPTQVQPPRGMPAEVATRLGYGKRVQQEAGSILLAYANVLIFALMVEKFAVRGFGDLPVVLGGLLVINVLIYRYIVKRPSIALRRSFQIGLTAALASVPAVEFLRWMQGIEPVVVTNLGGYLAGVTSFVLTLAIPAALIVFLLLFSAAEQGSGSAIAEDKRPPELR